MAYFIDFTPAEFTGVVMAQDVYIEGPPADRSFDVDDVSGHLVCFLPSMVVER